MPLVRDLRRSHATILALVIVLGIFSRAAHLGWTWFDKSLGDVLYAMAAYFAIALLFPRISVALTAALATAACSAVEFLQLAEVNASLLEVPVLRWFLGTTFLWHDIACYLLGIALSVGLDGGVLRRPRRTPAQADASRL